MTFGTSCVAAILLVLQVSSGQQLGFETPNITPREQTLRVVKTTPTGTVLTTINVTNADRTSGLNFYISDFTTDNLVRLGLSNSTTAINVLLKTSLESEQVPSTKELFIVVTADGGDTTATVTMQIIKPVSSVLPGLNTTGLLENPSDVQTVISNLAQFTQSLCDVYSKQTPTTADLTRFRLFCLLFETVYKSLPPSIFPGESGNQAPRFIVSQVSVSVREDYNVGSSIATLTAVDKDGPNEIVYSPLDTTTNQLVRFLETGTSQEGRVLTIYLKQPLDRETMSSRTFYIGASDGQLTSTAMVRVTVEDINDNIPIFRQDVYNFVVSDPANAGQFVGNVFASDADSGQNGNVSYQLSGLKSDERFFNIHSSSGSIYLAESLRNFVNQTLSVIVNAKDGGGQFSSTSVLVFVSGNSTSDCRNTSCLNGGTCFRGNNGSYSCFCSREYYGLRCEYRNSTSDCRNTSCLNGGTCFRGNNGSYSCFCSREYYGLRCEYRNSTSDCRNTSCLNGGTCFRGINGSYSCFCSREYYGLRCEYRNSSSSCNIQCMNGGSCLRRTNGSYGCLCYEGYHGLQCQYRNPQQDCSANPCLNGGSCRRGYNGSYSCICYGGHYGSQCQFRDGMDDCLSSPCQNDASCILTDGVYTCHCRGGYTGTYCQFQTISDNCSISACLNGGFCHQTSSGNSTCECRSGHFGSRCEYRPDTTQFGPCSIPRCKNGGSCGTTGDGRFSCWCPSGFNGTACENDVSLRFASSSITLEVNEENAMGIPIGNIHVEDLLETSNQISITSDDSSGILRLEELAQRSLIRTWSVRLQIKLDREQKSSYRFIVKATDGRRTCNTTLVLQVQDINDNMPRFETSVYTTTVDSNVLPYTPIVTVSATDADVGNNSNIIYYIEGGSAERSRFNINNKTGVISVIDSLQNFAGRQFQLRIRAQDSGPTPMSGQALVFINIQQGNGRLRFNVRNTAVNVSESSSRGTQLAVLMVGPVYSGRPLTVSSNDTHGILKLNVTMATNLAAVSVFINSSIDREKNMTIIFTINATDGFSTATMTLSLNITDENDNAPRFVNTPDVMSVSRLGNPGDIIGRITAVDPDYGRNGSVTYDIIAGDMFFDAFNISKNTGVLMLDKYVAYYPESVSIVVRAKDGGNRQSLKNVTVMITYEPSGVCAQKPCKNNGTCANTGLTTFTCYCRSGFTGASCETNLECLSQPCLFDGTCTTNSAGNMECLCPTGYSGQFCENEPSLRFRQRNLNVTVQEGISEVPLGFIQLDDVLQPSVGQAYIRANDTLGVLRFERFDTSATASWRIILQASLDRERQSLHVFSLMGILGNRSINATLVIHVADVNDNAPVFITSMYSTAINNDEVRGTSVITVTAIDPDAGENGTISYSITGGSLERGRFSINRATGLIFVNTSLVSLVDQQIQLIVTAKDGGIPSRLSTAVVMINIQQGNGRLKFSANSFNVTVSEDTQRGMPLIELSVGPVFSGRQVSLTTNNTRGLISFMVTTANNEATALVSLNATLDRERNATEILFITARDGFDQTSTMLILNVTDVNDNFPYFHEIPKDVSISKNTAVGTYFSRVYAYDMDAGNNGTVSYEIVGGSKGSDFISISSKTGQLSVNRSLTSLDINTIVLIIKASDGGNPEKANFTNVPVELTTDPPTMKNISFSPRIYTATISEPLTRGMFVTQLALVDKDQNLLGSRITFRDPTFTVYADSFIIDRENSYVTLKLNNTIIPQDQKRVVLFAEVTNERITANCTIIINVARGSDNFNSPIFSRSQYEVRVQDSLAPGTFILTVSATDSDSGQNGVIRYRMTQGNATFAIDANTGGISTKIPLVPLNNTVQTLTVVAVDLGQPPKMATAKVRIEIGQPVSTSMKNISFSSRIYSAAISEPLTKGKAVIQLTLIDRNQKLSGSRVHFRDPSFTVFAESFVIDKEYSVVSVKLNNTGISQNQQTVVLFADIPNEGVTANCTIVINIQRSDNRFSPTFSNSNYSIQIPDTQAIGRVFLRVSAQDRDVGQNGVIQYRMTQGNTIFSIDANTGDISAKGPLLSMRNTVQTFTVLAVDMGQPPKMAQAEVRVTIVQQAEPINMPPQFVGQPYYYIVSENLPKETFIGNVVCTDNDGGDTITVTLQNSETGTFKLGQSNTDGSQKSIQLLTNASLDRETTSRYSFQVLAFDGRSTATATVTIQVDDVNDNSPMFSKPVYTADVPVNTAARTIVMTAQAQDADSGSNGEIIFRKQASVNPDLSAPFLVEPSTGRIIVGLPLTGLEGSLVEFSIVVVDKGTPPLMSTATIKINITEVAANFPPVFVDIPDTITVDENTDNGHRLFMAVIKDTDGPNKPFLSFADRVSFETAELGISAGNNTHTLTSINLKTFLNREMDDRKVIKLVASDGLESTTATVTVLINDVNDNAPRFSLRSYSGLVSSDAAIGVSVRSVSANDLDQGDNGRVLYSLQRTSVPGLFSVDSLTGIISVAGDLSDWVGRTVNLRVEARDQGTPILNASVAVDISIQNGEVVPIPNVSPMFTKNNYTLSVSENSIGNILRLDVTDSDGPQGVTFRVVGGKDPDSNDLIRIVHRFQPLSTTWTVFIGTVRAFDREIAPSYVTVIIASDSVAETTATVTIQVEDINDNSPQFEQSSYVESLSDDAPVGKTILQPVATDQDTGLFGEITYTLTTQTEADRLTFGINGQTGSIFLQRPLSELNVDYTSFTVTATDGGQRSTSASVDIKIISPP